MTNTLSQNLYLECIDKSPEPGMDAIHRGLFQIHKPLFVVDQDGTPAACHDGRMVVADSSQGVQKRYRLLSHAPALQPKNLGNPDFKRRYNITYPYIAGAMAHGISSVELVKSAGNAGMLGFFGAAGLSLPDLEKAVLRLKSEGSNFTGGFNLVFAGAPEQEMAIVKLYLKHGVSLISAAGYLRLTLPLLYYRIKGIYQDTGGRIVCPNKIIAKTSRLEIAKQFLSPPPDNLIRQLTEQNLISPSEAALANNIPVAEDLTAEADSGGHTDNRAAVSLLPSMIDLRDRLYEKYRFAILPCIGMGGGIATPKSVSAALAMGADYVLAGSVNQSCIESGTSDLVREMLAKALQTDVIMAPSANMFERGIKVQVLKRGTLFPQRAARLYEIYRTYDTIDDLPEHVKKEVEEKIFQSSIASEWDLTCDFLSTYDPSQLAAAEKNSKRKMGLVFRSYLGKSSKWAIQGDLSRKKDFQIWCGPSMGAFNEWAAGSFLEKPEKRDFKTIATNLLFGACVVMRRQWLTSGGLNLPVGVGKFTPMTLSALNDLFPEFV